MKRFFMLTAALIALSSSIAFAQNGSTVVRWEICDYMLYNPCCEEFVSLCLNVQIVVDKDGNWKSGSAKGGGVGANGGKYIFADNTHWDSKWNPVGANQYTYSSRQRLTAVGNSDCSFTVNIQWLIVVNANGDVTATIDKFSVDCGNGDLI